MCDDIRGRLRGEKKTRATMKSRKCPAGGAASRGPRVSQRRLDRGQIEDDKCAARRGGQVCATIHTRDDESRGAA